MFPAQALGIDGDAPALTGPQEDDLGPAIRFVALGNFDREFPSVGRPTPHLDYPLLLYSPPWLSPTVTVHHL
jgi:hypothetical protein